ncbi:zinc-binding dehydrogenase [Maribacter sp. CXY002]|uniref:zinc-binding dehydrogenase n=1 Tax=Maribacter luteocoastalis TaxID=3407671 RepID=UPI003B677E23
MKAVFLTKFGSAHSAFAIRETKRPKPSSKEVLIKVEAFGLNFADVMARLGYYRATPKLPAILGYDVVGEVIEIGAEVNHIKVGDRVTALTRFGGYAEYAIANNNLTFKITDSLAAGTAVALATQYTTAYVLSNTLANLQENDQVLIHAAAGGVGTALTQMALYKRCIVFGTCSSQEKINYLRENGVQHPINYKKIKFDEIIQKILGKKRLDVIFDPVGGKSVKKGYRLLGAGGRLFSFGVSSMNQTKNIFGKLKIVLQFGMYHPLQFLSNSNGIIGVNILKIGEERPEKLSQAMEKVVKMTEDGILKPHVGGDFHIDELANAHEFLESRKSMGKIVVRWN